MITKGYLKRTDDAQVLHRGMQRLTEAGVPLEGIVLGVDPSVAVEALTTGDELVVLSLVELCTNIRELSALLRRVDQCGARLRSLDEPELDTARPAPDWQAAISVVEKIDYKYRSQTTRAGLSRAQANGTKLGRPRGTTTISPQTFETALALYNDSCLSVKDICALKGCNTRTFYRYLKQNNLPTHRKETTAPSSK